MLRVSETELKREKGGVAELESALSSERLTPEKIEEELKRIGFLDPSFGNKERWCSRDPILALFYMADREIILPPLAGGGEPRRTTVINEYIRAAHDQFARAYGEIYTGFQLIQETMATLLSSKDTHAKIMMFLCMLAIDEGLQAHVLSEYPRDGGPEPERFPVLLSVVKEEMEEVLNTAYVNVPVPNRYNVEHLLLRFLDSCITRYPA